MRLANNFALIYILGAAGITTTTKFVSAAEQLRGKNHRQLQGNGNGNGNRPISECYTTNVVEVQHEDPSIEETRIECGTEDGEFYDMALDDDTIKNNKADVANGKKVAQLPVGAMIANNRLVLPAGAQASLKPNSNSKAPWAGRDLQQYQTPVEYSVLVVHVDASDASTTASQEALSDSVFGNNADGNGADTVNLKSQYNACSYGKMQFVEATAKSSIDARPNIINGKKSFICLFVPLVSLVTSHTRVHLSTIGATTVSVNVATTAGDSTMRSAITNELKAQFGVSSPTALANKVMYCLPPGTMSGIAYAYINSWNSVYSDNWCMYVSGQMHEIGHNIGLAHSNEAGTYKDQSGMMGYSYGSNNTPRMCFNGAKSWQLGWYSTRHDVFTAPGTMNYRLVGQADFLATTASDTVILKINSGTATDYYVSFNRQTGNNSQTQEAANQVTIQRGGEGNGYAESELVKKLINGGTYVISNFDGTGVDLTVTVTALDLIASPAYANIQVSAGQETTPGPTPPPTPPPTLAPVTPSPTNPPTNPLRKFVHCSSFFSWFCISKKVSNNKQIYQTLTFNSHKSTNPSSYSGTRHTITN